MKIKTFLYSSTFILLLTSSSFAVVSTPVPSPTLAQVAQSMSYASSTNNNIDISETTSQTSNLIDSNTLQADVVTAAESAGLEVDTEALELLSTADGGTTAIAQMNNDNLENKFGDDYEATMDVNTMVFKDADWVDLEKQTTSSITGQTYSSNNNFFNNCSGCQQGRSATYINLAKGEISAKIWVRSKVRVNDPTSEGTTVSPEHHTGVGGLTTFPITGYVDATIDPDGTSNSGTFTEGQPASLVNSATTLAKPFEEGGETGVTREMLMDKFNNGFTGGEDKIFMVAKGVSDGNTLTGVIAIEGGSCVDACTEQQFVESVERWESTSKLVGAKWDGKNFDF